MNIRQFILKLEKYSLYIGLILFCFVLNFMIGYVPYLNLQREVVLTVVYVLVAYYIGFKLNFSSIQLVSWISVLIVVFALLSFVSFAEVLANVLFLLMFVAVIRMLRSSSNEK